MQRDETLVIVYPIAGDSQSFGSLPELEAWAAGAGATEAVRHLTYFHQAETGRTISGQFSTHPETVKAVGKDPVFHFLQEVEGGIHLLEGVQTVTLNDDSEIITVGFEGRASGQEVVTLIKQVLDWYTQNPGEPLAPYNGPIAD